MNAHSVLACLLHPGSNEPQVPKVAAIGAAKRDGAAVAIKGPGLAGDVAFANEGAQVFGGSLPGGPSIGARLGRLGRVDSPKAIGHAIDLERVAVNHAGRLSEGGRGNEREGSSQGGQFHRCWLARDWGNKAATDSAIRLVEERLKACVNQAAPTASRPL
jgi:hypothetical protein